MIIVSFIIRVWAGIRVSIRVTYRQITCMIHRSFTTISLCLCGAVDWLFDSECG